MGDALGYIYTAKHLLGGDVVQLNDREPKYVFFKKPFHL